MGIGDAIFLSMLNQNKCKSNKLLELKHNNKHYSLFYYQDTDEYVMGYWTAGYSVTTFIEELRVKKSAFSKYIVNLFRMYVYRGLIVKHYTCDDDVMKYIKYLKDALWSYDKIIEKSTEYRIALNRSNIDRLEQYGVSKRTVTQLRNIQESIEQKVRERR